ncbi:MAG: AbrB/MazE/SpoVT family DNA-binding domain-containing protein [Dehalococcoidia bacterium]
MPILTVTVADDEGTITLPKEIREKHSIKKGQEIRLIDIGVGKTITLYVVPPGDPIERGLGMFKGGPSMTAGLLEDRRRELEQEERGLPPPQERD